LSAGNSLGPLSFYYSFDGGSYVAISSCQGIQTNIAVCSFVPTSPPGPGTYGFEVTFAGNKTYAPAQATTSALVTSTTSMSLSFSGSTHGSPVTITATVSPSPDAGTVSFTLSSPKVSLPSTCSSVTVVSGMASCTFTPSAAGTYSFSASYSGDALYQASSATGRLGVS